MKMTKTMTMISKMTDDDKEDDKEDVNGDATNTDVDAGNDVCSMEAETVLTEDKEEGNKEYDKKKEGGFTS